jgi:hypothetical protein
MADRCCRKPASQQKGRTVTKEIKAPDANHPISIDAGTTRVVARAGFRSMWRQ